MRNPAGPSSGASVDGTAYPANEDGTVTVPTGNPVAVLSAHGFEVVEVFDAPDPAAK
jgi:hypothetical protein